MKEFQPEILALSKIPPCNVCSKYKIIKFIKLTTISKKDPSRTDSFLTINVIGRPV